MHAPPLTQPMPIAHPSHSRYVTFPMKCETLPLHPPSQVSFADVAAIWDEAYDVILIVLYGFC